MVETTKPVNIYKLLSHVLVIDSMRTWFAEADLGLLQHPRWSPLG